MIRRILVTLDATPFTAVAVRGAAELARQHGAEVTGLAVVDARRLERLGSVPIGAGVYAESLRRHRIRKAWEQLEQSAAELQRTCEEEGVPCTVVREEGRVLEVLAAQARNQDLVLLGARALSRCRGPRTAKALVSRAAGCGCRTLIAVSGEYRPVRRALVAYSGSSESAHALRSFLQLRPWPEAQLKVVTWGRSPQQADELLGEAAQYCRAQGWDPELAYLPGPPGRNLLFETSRWHPDVMVTGDGTLTWLLRSATRDPKLLAAPLFVAV